MSNKLVLKVGGSLIYDKQLKVNVTFLSKLAGWIEIASSSYSHIVIVVGGGNISRHINNELGLFLHENSDKHELGMELTHLNAFILSKVLGISDFIIPRTLGEVVDAIIVDKKPLIVCGGYKAGWSTDMDAAVLADLLKLDKVYKLSNIEGVYTKDPKKFPDARFTPDMNWREYFELFQISQDSELVPGGNSPVGVKAAQFASKKGISFYVSGGKNLELDADFSTILQSGSIIHP